MGQCITMRLCEDPECGAFFMQVHSRHRFCNIPECVERRKRKKNHRDYEHRRELLKNGEAEVHKHVCRRITTKPKTAKKRVCLKCDKEFVVPKGTDNRICTDCHLENDELIAEYTPEALGVVPLRPRSSVNYGDEDL